MIENNAWSAEHDFEVHGLYQGEPFLIGGVLCFFDGENLFLCGRALPRAHRDLRQALNQLITDWQPTRPRRISCWGDTLPSDEVLRDRDYSMLYEQSANPDNDELVLDYVSPDATSRLEKRRAEALARTRRYSRVLCEGAGLSWQELRLIQGFVCAMGNDLDSVDLSYYLTVPQFLAAGPPDRVVHARLEVEGKIEGFAFARLLSHEFAVFHIAIWNRALPRACDALYLAIVDEVKRRGVRRLSLGMSINRGLFRYKERWGARPLGKGMLQRIWCDRRDEAAQNLSRYHWPAALAAHWLCQS